MKRLAIITTHPIQYNAPLFELLSQRKNIPIKVFYTWGESVLKKKYDPGFDKEIEWDIPLLKGYEYEFVENVAKEKGSHQFNGVDNPYLIERIKEFNPTALLIYGWSFKSHLKVMRYFKGKLPVLFRGDSTLLNESSFFSAMKRRLFLKWVYRNIDIALYVGKNNYEYYRKAGLRKDQLVFAPHVVDNSRFECTSEDCRALARQFRGQLNISENSLVFLYAGKFEEVKDPTIIPKAFVKAQLKGDVHLVMVGNGILEKPLKEEYGDFSNIHFLDFQNQTMMPSIYEMADVYILSSKSETWGLAVNEAMANGKAIIVSDQCGCAVDLVKNGKNGYIFRSGNIEDLQNKLGLVSGNRDKLAEMKKYSKSIIQDFSLTLVAEIVEKQVRKF